MLIDFTLFHLVFGFAFLALLLVILWRRTRSFFQLLFFTIFWIYLLAVVQVVIFPIHIAIANDRVSDVYPSVNLIPFYFGPCSIFVHCLRNIYRNILLTIPFGFGFPFIIPVKAKNIRWIALAVGLTLETAQLGLALVFHSSFRVIDINDVILNALGVLLGYGIFFLFAQAYLAILERLQLEPVGLFAYIRNIVKQNHPEFTSLRR